MPRLMNKSFVLLVHLLLVTSSLPILAQGGTIAKWKGKFVYWDPFPRNIVQAMDFCEQLDGEFPHIQSQQDIDQLNRMFVYYTKIWVKNDSSTGIPIYVESVCKGWPPCCTSISGKILEQIYCEKKLEVVCVLRDEIFAMEQIWKERKLARASFDLTFMTDMDPENILSVFSGKPSIDSARKIASLEKDLKLTCILLTSCFSLLIFTVFTLILTFLFRPWSNKKPTKGLTRKLTYKLPKLHQKVSDQPEVPEKKEEKPILGTAV